MSEAAHHVGMVEPLDRIELALEPGQRIDRAHQLEVENFDRDDLAIAVPPGAPDLPEPAFTDQAVELVTRDGEWLRTVQQSTLTIAAGGAPNPIAPNARRLPWVH